MEEALVYSKTELGAGALTTTRGTVSSSARQFLILVDGRRSLGELAQIFGVDAVERLAPQLESQGFIRRTGQVPAGDSPIAPRSGNGNRDRGARGSAAAPGGSERGPATVTPNPTRNSVARIPDPWAVSTGMPTPATRGAPAPAAAAPPSTRLAITLLALIVLGVSGAIWWFFGPMTALNAPAAPEAVAVAPAAPSPITSAPPIEPPDERSALRLREPERPAGKTAIIGPTRPGPDAPDRGRPTLAPAPLRAAPPSAPSPIPQSPSPAPSPAVNAPKPAPIADTPAANAPPSTPIASAPAPVPAPPDAVSAPTPTPALAAAPPAAASTVAPAPVPGVPAVARNAVTSPTTPPAPAPASPPVKTAPTLVVRTRQIPVLSRRVRQLGIDHGRLVVKLHVDTSGAVSQLELVSAEPSEIYDKDMRNTLQSWTYQPPPVPAVATVELDFSP